jgi:NhaP-type Na+/H+ or K+/H+ antiporter
MRRVPIAPAAAGGDSDGGIAAKKEEEEEEEEIFEGSEFSHPPKNAWSLDHDGGNDDVFSGDDDGGGAKRIDGASSEERMVSRSGTATVGWWEEKKTRSFYYYGMGRRRRMLLKAADADEEQEEVGESSVAQQQHPQKQEKLEVPLISLNIPTSNKHVSEGMLNEALLLQQTDVAAKASVSESRSSQDSSPPRASALRGIDDYDGNNASPEEAADPEEATLTAANRPNITADAAAAVKDVAESAEAIRTAVEGVQKSMMNDPKSVEARTCCASILSVFHDHCDPTTTGVEDYSDQRLLVVVFVITVCGMVKSLIRHLNIRWLPEAGGCILVGVFGYLVLQHMPHVQFAFDGDMFLRIMVPPIVFEAAVKINKQSFRRHVIPITIFAIVGTLASTAFTAFILHKGSIMLGHYATTIPVKESLIFGALISSIDPIAVLSVLSSMGMTDTDTIYVLIFGESLLNDGVAIVLFQTLVHFLDESLVIDSEVILDASMHFVVVALGSISVGMASGACATLYFSLMHGCQTPMVEVIMFCCWSFVPYYVCDMVEWSGIVAIVANGFIMDLYVIGQKHQQLKTSNSDVDDEIDFLVNGTGSTSSNANGRTRPYRQQQCRSIFSYEGHLSPKADIHVHFVIEIFATLMETAIFAYLGLFLFSPRYHWNFYLSLMSVFATILGRVIMIPLFSHVANVFNRMSLLGQQQQSQPHGNEGVHIDRRMQVILVFAGLRGAMSFALVEHIPMFDTTTGQGSRLKPELKAMTSASIIFTLFVLGGATSYLLERLGYSVNKQHGGHDDVEIVPLMGQTHDKRKSPMAVRRKTTQANDMGLGNNSNVRQRGHR